MNEQSNQCMQSGLQVNAVSCSNIGRRSELIGSVTRSIELHANYSFLRYRPIALDNKCCSCLGLHFISKIDIILTHITHTRIKQRIPCIQRLLGSFKVTTVNGTVGTGQQKP